MFQMGFYFVCLRFKSYLKFVNVNSNLLRDNILMIEHFLIINFNISYTFL